MNKWNPYFVYYAKSNGNPPEVQLAIDKNLWLGGCMTGFILWMARKKREFRKINPSAFLGNNIYNHKAWSVFLGKNEANTLLDNP